MSQIRNDNIMNVDHYQSNSLVQKQEAGEAVAELNDKISALEEVNAQLDTRIAGLETFSEYADIISLSIAYSEDGMKHILIDNAGTWEYIDYDLDSSGYAEKTLRSKLQALADSDAPVFIVFSYADEAIRTPDYKMISSVLSDLKADNLYIQTKKKTVD